MTNAKTDGHVIEKRLTEAGWSGARNEELGAPSLTYDNGSMTIAVEQEYGERELIVTMTAPSGMALTLYPVYGDELDATLEVIIEWSGKLSEDTFQQFVRALVRACPKVYSRVDDDEDSEPVLLTDD